VDREQVAAELDAVRPYLDLAKEIQRQVERFAADDAAEVESQVRSLEYVQSVLVNAPAGPSRVLLGTA